MTLLPQQAGPFFSCEFAPALEDYLWQHLTDLWGFIPLQRRSPLPKPFHDILALEGDRLVAILLKGTEDQWLVYQVTAYHQYLISERPFAERVNYDHPIRIMVLAPCYHPNTFVQQQRAEVTIEFWTATGLDKTGQFAIELLDGRGMPSGMASGQLLQKIWIADHPIAQNSKVSDESQLPPKTQRLQQFLDKARPSEREGVEKIWHYLLRSNLKLTEFSHDKGVRIGIDKTFLCFEIAKDPERQQLALFLWLPCKLKFANFKEVSCISRMRIWTNWQIVTDIGYVPEGIGKKVTFTEFRAAAVKPMKRALGKRSYHRYYTDEVWRKIVADEQEARYNRHPWSDYKYEYALTIPQYEKLMNIRLPDYSLMTFIELSLKSLILPRKSLPSSTQLGDPWL